MRLLRNIFLGLVFLLLVTVGVTFLPGVQKAIFLRVANAGDFTVAVDDFRLRPGGLSVSGLEAAGLAGGLSLQGFQVNASLLQIIQGRIHLDEVVVRGLEIRLTDARESGEKTPFSLDTLREALEEFQGILPGLEPDLAVRRLTLGGVIFLPDQEALHFEVSGGGLGRGSEGVFTVSLRWGDVEESPLATAGARVEITLGEQGEIAGITLQGEVEHPQAMLPPVLRFDLALRSDREGESYRANLTTPGGERILALEGSWRPTPGLLELSGEVRLPETLAEQGSGEGVFRLAARTREGVVQVELQTVGEWLGLPEVLAVAAADVTANLSASVDLQRKRIVLDDWEGALAGSGTERPWIATQLLEPVEIDLARLDQLPQRNFLSLEIDLPQPLLQKLAPALSGGALRGAWALAGEGDSLVLSATEALSFALAPGETPLNALRFSGMSRLQLNPAEASLTMDELRWQNPAQGRELRGRMALTTRNWTAADGPLEARLFLELQEAAQNHRLELEAALTPPETGGDRPSLTVDSLKLDLDLPALQSFFLKAGATPAEPAGTGGAMGELPRIRLPVDLGQLHAAVRLGLPEGRVEGSLTGRNLAAGQTGELGGEFFFYGEEELRGQLVWELSPQFDAAGDLRLIRATIEPVAWPALPPVAGMKALLLANWQRPAEWLTGSISRNGQSPALIDWKLGVDNGLQGEVRLQGEKLEEFLTAMPLAVSGLSARGVLSFSRNGDGWEWTTREALILGGERVTAEGFPALQNVSVRWEVDQGSLSAGGQLLLRLAMTARIGEIPVLALAGELGRPQAGSPLRLRGSAVADVAEWRKTSLVNFIPNLQRGLMELRVDLSGGGETGWAGSAELKGGDLARLDGFEVYGFSLQAVELKLAPGQVDWRGEASLLANRRRTVIAAEMGWMAEGPRPSLKAVLQGQTLFLDDLIGFSTIFEQPPGAGAGEKEAAPLKVDLGMDATLAASWQEVVLPGGQRLQNMVGQVRAGPDQILSDIGLEVFGGQIKLRPELRQQGEQVVLDLTGGVRGLPIERLLAPPEQLRTAPLSGSFSGDWVFSARGRTPHELVDSLTGSVQMEGRSGVLRALKPGERVTRLVGAGSVAGSILGRAFGRPALAALGDIIPLLSEVPYQTITIRADRLADQTIRLDSLQLLGSYLFLSGGGTMGPAPLSELRDGRLDLVLQVGAKPPLAGPLDIIGALGQTPNPQGYLPARETVRVQGTVGAPTAEEFWGWLIALVERAATLSEADLRREREQRNNPGQEPPSSGETVEPPLDPIERGVNRLIDILGR